MKKAALILGFILIVFVSLFYILTDPVDLTPFYETNYYKKSVELTGNLLKGTTAAQDSLKAGFSKVSLTPGLNNPNDDSKTGKFKTVPLAGFGARKGKGATGIHDSIFVKAVALNVGQKKIIMVGADLLIMPPNIIDTVAILLKEKGIDREQVFFSASHSHSSLGAWGPGFLAEQFAGKENHNIQKWVAAQIVKAVVDASNDLKPAQIGYGVFKAGTWTRNRLIGEAGIKNDDFGYLYLVRNDGKKAVVGSFSAHSTTMGAGNMEISADYPGYWQRKMEASSVNLAVFMAGSVGSQSPAVEGNGFEKPCKLGEALADSLNKYLPETTLAGSIKLSPVSVKLPIPEFHIRISKNRGLSTGISDKLMKTPQNPYIQAIRIGQMVWVSAPSDFSGEYAVQIKNNLAAAGFLANVSSFNGSYMGYIIPGRYFFIDGYEPQTMGWFGPNMGEYAMDVIRRVTNIAIQ